MKRTIVTMDIRFEHDVVVARQRSRQIAAMLGFGHQDQTRISTAVSEIARNAFQYAGAARVEFSGEDAPEPAMFVSVDDEGKGISDLQQILDGQYTSKTGMGLGIAGARRLMDVFDIHSVPGEGTRIRLGKKLPAKEGSIRPQTIARIANELAKRVPETPLEEIQQQNRELLRLLDELRARSAELERINRELEDTNRGVVALYAELDDKADSLQRASDLKTRFLSNMSHEFRTPLNAVLSLSRLLLSRSDGELTPEQEKQVGYIRKSAEDLSELVNDLLDLAKVEAGKSVVHPRGFEVRDLFSALRGMLRPLVVSAAVELVFEEPRDIPMLFTDDSKISQVLRNFISNALKFTERGHVRVSAEMIDPQHIRFSVADTGIGIAPEDQARIFEEWVQVDSPLQRKVKGTGLGLPLSKKLTQVLAGKIYVKSELGVGSTFFAEFPVAYAGAAVARYSHERTQALDPEKLPVLVLEDNQETMVTYESFLRDSPYQLVPASRLSEGREFLRRTRPAAVLLDVLLYNESTRAFVTELKSSEATRKIPVIVATVANDEAKAKALKADAFCVKPVERSWLLETLNRMVRIPADSTVLLIDDDELDRYLMRGVLAGTGWKLIEISDPIEGLRRVREQRPGAVILDLMMTEMSGFEVLHRIKSDPATSNIPVIVSTSKILDPEERRTLERDACAIVPKEGSSREAQRSVIVAALERAGLLYQTRKTT
jgi:signal transduction histidine kinase/CheY-like chemotaxis protein